MNMITDIVGYAAAFVGTFLMMPQILKAMKTKSMSDVSDGMLFAYILNCALWDVYGILLGAMPVVVCNTIALGIGFFQLGLKQKYG